MLIPLLKLLKNSCMKKYRPDRYHIINCQKTKLIDAVKELSNELGRPVCSRDLKEYFFDHPEEQPLLRQCLGQQLLKATRTWKTGVSAIRQIGIIGKYNYYASTDASAWKEKFNHYALKLSIQEELKLGMGEKAISLIDSPYEGFARNALAGFISEWTPALKNESIAETDFFAEAMNEAQKYASKKFVRRGPKNLISRKQALRFLQTEACRRLGKYRSRHINYDRYLAPWHWPQNRVFQKTSKLLYAPEQLALLAQKTWPTFEDDPYLAEAVLVCSRYGFAHFPSESIGR